MARIYSAVLAHGSANVGPGTSTFATVPSGEVWVVRSAQMIIPAAMTSGPVQLSWLRSSTIYPFALYQATGSYQVTYNDYRSIGEAGDSIALTRSPAGSGTLFFWISGYRLVALP